MTRRQSLKVALKDPNLALARSTLDGCPVGGWAETEQAKRDILNDLPPCDARTYSLAEFISAAYTVDHAARYRSK